MSPITWGAGFTPATGGVDEDERQARYERVKAKAARSRAKHSMSDPGLVDVREEKLRKLTDHQAELASKRSMLGINPVAWQQYAENIGDPIRAVIDAVDIASAHGEAEIQRRQVGEIPERLPGSYIRPLYPTEQLRWAGREQLATENIRQREMAEKFKGMSHAEAVEYYRETATLEERILLGALMPWLGFVPGPPIGKAVVAGARLARKVAPIAGKFAGEVATAPVRAMMGIPGKQGRTKRLLGAEQIGDFNPLTDKVIREGGRIFIIDTTGLRAKQEIRLDIVTPEYIANINKLTPEQRIKMIEAVENSRYLSDEGRAERLALLKPSKPLPGQAAMPEAKGNYLYHGASKKNLESIRQKGLQSQTRARNDYGNARGEYADEPPMEELLYFERKPNQKWGGKGRTNVQLRVNEDMLPSGVDVSEDVLRPKEFYTSHRRNEPYEIPPEAIEYLDSKTGKWIPLAKQADAGQAAMPAAAAKAGEAVDLRWEVSKDPFARVGGQDVRLDMEQAGANRTMVVWDKDMTERIEENIVAWREDAGKIEIMNASSISDYTEAAIAKLKERSLETGKPIVNIGGGKQKVLIDQLLAPGQAPKPGEGKLVSLFPEGKDMMTHQQAYRAAKEKGIVKNAAEYKALVREEHDARLIDGGGGTSSKDARNRQLGIPEMSGYIKRPPAPKAGEAAKQAEVGKPLTQIQKNKIQHALDDASEQHLRSQSTTEPGAKDRYNRMAAFYEEEAKRLTKDENYSSGKGSPGSWSDPLKTDLARELGIADTLTENELWDLWTKESPSLRGAVEYNLNHGKPVPAEVLANYPDLAKQPAKVEAAKGALPEQQRFMAAQKQAHLDGIRQKDFVNAQLDSGLPPSSEVAFERDLEVKYKQKVIYRYGTEEPAEGIPTYFRLTNGDEVTATFKSTPEGLLWTDQEYTLRKDVRRNPAGREKGDYAPLAEEKVEAPKPGGIAERYEAELEANRQAFRRQEQAMAEAAAAREQGRFWDEMKPGEKRTILREANLPSAIESAKWFQLTPSEKAAVQDAMSRKGMPEAPKPPVPEQPPVAAGGTPKGPAEPPKGPSASTEPPPMGQRRTMDEAKATVGQAAKWFFTKESDVQNQLTQDMFKGQRARRAAEFRETIENMRNDPDLRGLSADEINQRALEKMKGPLGRPPPTLTQGITEDIADSMFDMVYHTWHNTNTFEEVSAAEALRNALQGKGIPRERGTGTKAFPEGGSAYDRLAHIFKDQPGILDMLEESNKTKKPLRQVVEEKLIGTGKVSDWVDYSVPYPWPAIQPGLMGAGERGQLSLEMAGAAGAPAPVGKKNLPASQAIVEGALPKQPSTLFGKATAAQRDIDIQNFKIALMRQGQPPLSASEGRVGPVTLLDQRRLMDVGQLLERFDKKFNGEELLTAFKSDPKLHELWAKWQLARQKILEAEDLGLQRFKLQLQGKSTWGPGKTPFYRAPETERFTTSQPGLMPRWTKEEIEWINRQVESHRRQIPPGTIYQAPPIQKILGQPSLIPLNTRVNLVGILKEAGMSILDIGNAMRTMVASFDNSWWRQAAPLIMNHKNNFVKANLDSWGAVFSQKRADAAWEVITKSPLYHLYEKIGADFLRPLEVRKGERFKGVEELGFLTKDRPIPNFMTKLPNVKLSFRGFTTGINSHTWGIFEEFYNKQLQLSRRMATHEIPTPAEGFNIEKNLKEMATLLEDLSGRARLGKAAAISPAISALAFAPRLAAGRILSPRHLISANAFVRKEAWQDLAWTVGFTGTFIMAGKAMGAWDVETDPRSPLFARIRIGNTVIDPWGGYQKYVRFVAQMATKSGISSTTGAKYESTPKEMTVRLLQGMASPIASLLIDSMEGKNFIGEPVDIKNPKQWMQRLAPMVVTDIYDAFTESGPGIAAAITPLTVMGIGVQSYNMDIQRLAKQWQAGLEQYEAIPSDPLEVAKARRDNPKFQSRNQYRIRNHDLDAKLFIMGEVSDVLTDKAMQRVKTYMKLHKINPDNIKAIQKRKEQLADAKEFGIPIQPKIIDKLIPGATPRGTPMPGIPLPPSIQLPPQIWQVPAGAR